MHCKSDNIDILIDNKTNKIIEDLFNSIPQKHQKGLEELVKDSEFVFDSVNSSYYKLRKISLKTGGSYIDSPESLKNEKATINKKKKMKSAFSML